MFYIQQQIKETENRINLLLARYLQPITRDDQNLNNLIPAAIHTDMPSQLLANRPDIKQADLELVATKLGIQVARAQFYLSVGLSAGVGYQAFNPTYLLRTSKLMLFSPGSDLVLPSLIKRH